MLKILICCVFLSYNKIYIIFKSTNCLKYFYLKLGFSIFLKKIKSRRSDPTQTGATLARAPQT